MLMCTQILYADFDSVGLGWSLRLCMSIRLPADAYAAGCGDHTLGSKRYNAKHRVSGSHTLGRGANS